MESHAITSTLTIVPYEMPDGSYAFVRQEMNYGDIVIILLLIALLFVHIYTLWTRQRSIR
jgi:hypothetical protein